ncbi:MAG: DsbA family protein [Alphaproteobacteria bacterium]|nr:MAG: DsbA family protein [Alphaproteobacteria bacterium]
MASKRKLSNLSLASLAVLIGLMLYGGYHYHADKRAREEGEFGEKVRGYLLAHPQVLREVIAELKKQDMAAAEAEQRAKLAAVSSDLTHDPDSFVAGNPNGDVTIVEFFDYRCGYCKQSYPDVMKTVAEDGNIRLVLKEFPILGDQSVMATKAALAAGQQNKYIELHDALMAAHGSFSKERIIGIAGSLGIDTEKLAADMEDPKIHDIVSKNYALATKLGINGTPAFVVGNHFVPGVVSAEDLKAFVASARETAAKSPETDTKT